MQYTSALQLTVCMMGSISQNVSLNTQYVQRLIKSQLTCQTTRYTCNVASLHPFIFTKTCQKQNTLSQSYCENKNDGIFCHSVDILSSHRFFQTVG